MASIKREIEITDITPEEVAAQFCSMLDDEQAAFFTEVGRIAKGWPGAGWCQQSHGIALHAGSLAVETILKLAEHIEERNHD